MIINHNLNALNANRMVGVNSTNASKAMAQLSSGLRINSAADDAAGLAISEKMKGQINGLNTASSNAQTAVSLTQTADGALTETTSVLQRMRELAVQSSNDTNTTADRTAIQTEATALTKQIDNIATTTQFNTKNLLDGSLSGVQTLKTAVTAGTASLVSGSTTTNITGVTGTATNGQVGTHVIGLSVGTAGQLTSTASVSASQTLASLGVQNVAGLTVGLVGAQVGVTGVPALTSNSTVQDLMTAINNSAGGVTASIDQNSHLVIAGNAPSATEISFADTATTGDISSTIFSGTADVAGAITSGNADAAKLTVTDSFTALGSTAPAVVTVDRSGYTAGAGGTLTLLAGSGANGIHLTEGTAGASATTLTVNTLAAQNSVAAKGDTSMSMQIGANSGQTMNVAIDSMTSSALNVNALDFTTQTGAEAAISAIDTATATVSNTRSQIGAYQNRLTSTINNLGTTSQNLTSAQSAITDVDMAATMAEFSKDNVESQAAQAMISQANQQPAQVLQLLR